MLSLRSFSPMAVRFSATPPFSPTQPLELGTHKVGSEMLIFTQVGAGIRITQTGSNKKVLELQPNGITVDGINLDTAARKELARVFKTLIANVDKYRFYVNRHTYNATITEEAVIFNNPKQTLESLSIKPDLIRIADGQVNEKGRKDLIAILQQLLKMQ